MIVIQKTTLLVQILIFFLTIKFISSCLTKNYINLIDRDV